MRQAKRPAEWYAPHLPWLFRRCGLEGAKRPFDNHLEGSSIKRYSEVAEAMTTLQYHPIEETEMPLNGGIALHANHRVVVLLHEQDQVISQ